MNEQFLVTSNRDESLLRQAPQPIQSYRHNNIELTYPKDVAGGTWIGYEENRNAMVLLNGGFEWHRREPPYRMSRGLIFLAMLASDDPIAHWEQMDFDNIEPFTLIFFSRDKQLMELVWDGLVKSLTRLDSGQRHLWMSTTLYKREYFQKIKEAFMCMEELDEEAIMAFHSRHYYQDNTQGHIIPQIRTVSISTITIGHTETSLVCKNLREMV